MQPGSVTINGKTYPFRADDSIAVVRGFEAWMVKTAYEELDRLRPVLSPTRFKEQEDGLRRDISAKMYRWGGDIYVQMRMTNDGQKELVRLMLQTADPTTPRSVVDELWSPDLDAQEAERISRELFGYGANPTGGTKAASPEPKS